MRRTLNHSAMPAVGFIEPWSVKAGAETNVHVSCVDAEAAIRIVSIDRDDHEVMAWPIRKHCDGFAVRNYDLGSWIELPAMPVSQAAELRFEVLFTQNQGEKPVCRFADVSVWLDEAGVLSIHTGKGSHPFTAVSNECWYELSLRTLGNEIEATLFAGDGQALARIVVPRGEGAGPVAIGSDGSDNEKTLNARVGRIGLLVDGQGHHWQFPARGPIDKLGSLEDADRVLTIHNMPTFAVASRRFTSEIHDPRLDPSQFDAIHLHDDDFGGFDWTADLTVTIPAEARSGIFAVEISTRQGVERLPFFVRPSRTAAKLAFLVSTATYLAYADERLPPVRYPWHGTDRGHRFAIDNDFLCLYDVHSDLSGVSLTSARRPKATVRDDYHYPLSNSPHLLPVDLQLLKFYAREGIAIDVITDRDLHEEGFDAAAPYRAILTGSHPEYWSTPMMAAIRHYLDAGGNLGYLGGNGFYWVVAYEGEAMELRRVKSDIWSGRPGEAHMSITGEPGGAWEDRGLMNPQSYLGVTYLIMSFGASRPYQRMEGSHDPRYAWLFEGIGDEPIGDDGTVLGGAAGYEVDAVVRSQETPPNLVVLATADGFDDSFQVRPDVWLADGDVERKTLRRADMTIYRHKGGGHVFCTGSVAWLGALPGPGLQNAVGQIMKNLAAGFGK